MLNIYFENKKTIQSYKLKNKLFAHGLKQKICEICLLSEWLKSEIPLELHHIDHNPNNNSFDNLQILCPNCHAKIHKKNKKAVKNKKRKHIADEELIKNIPLVKNIRSLLIKVGLLPSGGNYERVRNLLKSNLNVSFKEKKLANVKKNKIQHKTKISWPSKEEMTYLVNKYPTSLLSKQLGVSDSAIGKFCKKNKILKPGRGYWTKLKYINI